jgi:molybdopterin synthase catalytic subunit
MVLEEAMVLDKKLNFWKNLKLLAVHNSGKLVQETIVALIIAINGPSIQELFEAAEIIMSTISPTKQF